LIDRTPRQRLSSRLLSAFAAAALGIGAVGALPATAAAVVASDTPMILYNVPPEDLLANTRGVCDGSFDIVIRNTSGAAGALRYLDAAQHCGLKVILYFSPTANLTTGRVYTSAVGPLVRAVMNHPALYGYLSVKEPSWVHINGTEIRLLYKAFKAADPGHPVIGIWGDIPHFGTTANPYWTAMADIVMVDWYPIETAHGGCSTTGSVYIAGGSTWYSTKVRPGIARQTPNVPVWVMVQTHKYLAPTCHKKQLPNWTQLQREVREAFVYAGATGIAFHTFQNTNYTVDERRSPTMMSWMKAISASVVAGTFQ
jgi:hypothetical protein